MKMNSQLRSTMIPYNLQRTLFTISGLSFLALVTAAAGCGSAGADYSQLELLAVSGRVTLEGQPLAGAVVTFESPDGQFSYGLTDADGNYSLRLDSVKTGATPGPKTVRISTSRRILGLNADEGAQGGEVGEGNWETPVSPSTPVERLPARYHQTSELKAEVGPGKTTFDFALQTK